MGLSGVVAWTVGAGGTAVPLLRVDGHAIRPPATTTPHGDGDWLWAPLMRKRAGRGTTVLRAGCESVGVRLEALAMSLR
jgi:hypothetical protein